MRIFLPWTAPGLALGQTLLQSSDTLIIVLISRQLAILMMMIIMTPDLTIEFIYWKRDGDGHDGNDDETPPKQQ